MRTPQPASVLLELIGMLGLNSLVLVERLVMFWWKVLGQCGGEVWLGSAGLWCWEEPVCSDGPVVKVVLKAGMVSCETSPVTDGKSCLVKDSSEPWLAAGLLLGAVLQSTGLVHSMQNIAIGCKTDGEERIRLFGLFPGWAAEVFGFLSPKSGENS